MWSLRGTRCLVLGAGGFLGRAVATALCERGAVVHGFGRLPHDHRDLDLRMTWTTAELSDLGALASAVEGQAYVFHLLGSSVAEASSFDASEDLSEHVYRTVKLLDVCRAAKVRKLVFASSGGAVYGVAPIVPTPETAPAEPISAYGINRLAIENYLALYRRLHGLEYQVLRVGNAYGPGQSPFRRQGVVAATLYRALTGEPLEVWGPGATTRDFVHVDDVASAFAQAVHFSGDHRIMNVGSGEGRSLDALIADVKSVLNVPDVPVLRKPARPADVPVSILDTELIRRVTPWRPSVRWFEGLTETANWVRARYLS